MGGTGTWDNAALKWFNGATNVAYTSNKDVVFWGTAGTVTLGSPQSARSVWFKTNGYTVTGSTLTMTNSEISADAGVTATIGSVVAGAAGINKTGAGTIVLSNSGNTYTGGTTISAGTLRVSSDGALGAVPGALATNITLNGGTLQFGGNFDIANTRGIMLGATGGTIDTQGFTNPSGYNATAGGFTGPGDLTKMGSGTFFASAPSGGANTTWTGKLILKQGTWKIVASDGLPYNVPVADGLKPAQVTLDGGTWQVAPTTGTLSITNVRRGITVAAGGGTIDTQSHNFTWAGPLLGNVTTATLTKIGSGLLRFSQGAATPSPYASTYAGIVNVNGGTLQLDNGTAMGDTASINLANVAGATLNVTGNETIGSLSGGGATGGNVTLSAINLTTGGNNASTTYAGVISGSGAALTKTGSGTFTLTGANTYSGGTTVSGGVLRANNITGSATGSGAVSVTGGTLGGTGTIGGAISVSSGGHVAPGASAGTLSASNGLTLSSGTQLDYEMANVTTVGGGMNDLLAVTGSLTLGGSLILNIDAYQGDLANGTYRLITYTGALSGNTSGWTVGSNNASQPHSFSFSTATAGEINLIVGVGVAPGTWLGTVSANWGTGGNWSGGTEPGSTVDVTFPTPVPGTGPTITLAAGEQAKSITFNDTYALSGGDVTVATGAISVASSKTATIGSTVGGSSGITKSGAGTLVLSGANTYTGGTSVNAGTLRVSSDGNLGNAAGGVTFANGTLNTTASFSTARAVAINSGGGTIDTNAGVTTTLTGAISGAAGNTLTKSGGGTLLLNQPSPRSGLSSTWLGDITVSSGTLKVGNGGSTGFLPGYDPIAYAGLPPTVPTINLASGTTLEFNHAAGGPTQDATHAVVISGAGGVVISGAKAEVFVANNTYTGPTTINAGSSMRVGWGGALNSGGLGATAISNSGSLTFSNDHNTTFAGSISGTGSFLKEYNGTLVLTGADTSSGAHTVASGTLQIGNGGTTGSIAANITNNATLTFNRSDVVTHSAVISGGGAVNQIGSGTLALAGANTYTGQTSVSGGGTLRVSGDANLGAAPGALGTNINLDGGTLQWGANFDINSNRAINLGAAGGTIDTQGFSNAAGYTASEGFRGSGDLTKVGSGTFFMNVASGVNTQWLGNLVIKEGTWKTNNSGGLPENPTAGGLRPAQVTLDGGTLQFNGANNISQPNRGITVSTGGGVIDVQSFNNTWAGPISGSAGVTLTKMGSGLLRLGSTYASTYAGTMHVAEGTLQLNGGAAMGDLASVTLADVASAALTITTAGETIGSLGGGGAIGGNVSLGSLNLTAGGNNSSTTYAGIISGGGGSLTKTGAGTMTLNVNNAYTGATTVNGGTLVFNQSHTNSSSLTVASAATAQIAQHGGRVLKTASVNLTGTGKLDVTNNKAIITAQPGGIGSFNGSAYTGVTGLVQAGRGDGSWNGAGIVTSMTDATTGVLTTLAVATAGETGYAGGTFAGQSVSTDDVIVFYTWGGDADLNGELNGDDYFYIDSNVLTQDDGFHNGDFDYNGVIDGDDYFIIDSNITFAQNSPPFSTAAPVGDLVTVPEPGAFCAAGALMMMLGARRRRATRV